ncbi:hypothetical protein CTAYLR_003825 [Chrysophaeum taylorii]|uniref:GRIP domain-containing protein n=1 Tax=Chrysophaeum taylorii TaxID=2483200 RepID=A0AAD7XLT2_9STRA|nr:hypothetical protein CTAYLR_003825 [Chrysophaeum taylorii]
MKLSKRLKVVEAGNAKLETELEAEREKRNALQRHLKKLDPEVDTESLAADRELEARCEILQKELEAARAKHEEELVFLRHKAKQPEIELREKEGRLNEKEAQLTRIMAESAVRDNQSALKTKENRELAEDNAKLRRELAEAKLETRIVFAETVARDAFQAARIATLAATTKVPRAEAMALEFADFRHRLDLENARKSALARQIVVEKDAEITRLSAVNAEMAREAATGGHAHRRILEIAEAQAQREGRVHHEVRSQKIVNIKLHRSLKKREAEVADLHHKISKLKALLADARRGLHRDNLDVEYVKNVVVHYLSLPSGSSERTSLVPVLATVLQFTDADMKRLAKPTFVDRPNSPPLDLIKIDAQRRKCPSIDVPDEFDA